MKPESQLLTSRPITMGLDHHDLIDHSDNIGTRKTLSGELPQVTTQAYFV